MQLLASSHINTGALQVGTKFTVDADVTKENLAH